MSEEDVQVYETVYNRNTTIDVSMTLSGCINTLEYLLTDPGSDDTSPYLPLVRDLCGIWLPLDPSNSARILIKGHMHSGVDDSLNNYNQSNDYHGLYNRIDWIRERLYEEPLTSQKKINRLTQFDLEQLLAINVTLQKLQHYPFMEFTPEDAGFHYLLNLEPEIDE